MVSARKEMKLTQEQLAKLSNTSRALISNIERGEYTPSLPVAFRISKVLKKPIEHLFFKNNARKTS
ncbi:helix-turn-helix transcriptional regulator [Paenibacillus chitinolyticus]